MIGENMIYLMDCFERSSKIKIFKCILLYFQLILIKSWLYKFWWFKI